MSEYTIHRTLLLDDVWSAVAAEVSDFIAASTDEVTPTSIISVVPATPEPRTITAQSAADLNIPVEPEEWADEPVDETRCAHPGCYGYRASGTSLCRVHDLAARFRLPGFGLALALVTALLGACGGPAEVDTPERPAQPCAYVDSDAIYCSCARFCPGEPDTRCTMHMGRCDGSEATVCDTATLYTRTSTAVWSIEVGTPCGPDPVIRGL